MGRDTDSSKKVDISIVIPVYCNEDSLLNGYRILKEQVFGVQNQKKRTFEIIYVDDGSRDESLERLMTLRKNDPEHVKIIKFTRNFGQVSAIMAGLQYAKGNCMINISADLQDPPELINHMLDHHFSEGYHLVIGSRESRDESFFRRKASGLFYRIIRRISFPRMPLGGFDFFLVSSRLRDIVVRSREKNPFLQGQLLWPGLKMKTISYHRKQRADGRSRWTFSKKIKYLIDGVMGYSYFPMRIMTVLGMVLSCLGFFYAVFIFFARIFGGIPVKGWAPLMIMVLMLSGFQMLMLGIIGEYLWRTLDQVRNRESFVIEDIFD